MMECEIVEWQSNTGETTIKFYKKGTTEHIISINPEWIEREIVEEILKNIDVNDVYFKKPK